VYRQPRRKNAGQAGQAIFAAYGWPSDLSDEEILERLLALNLERAEKLWKEEWFHGYIHNEKDRRLFLSRR
jgi:hypothetical protein